MRVINRRLKLVAVISATLTIFMNGQNAFADFSGDFAPGNWTFNTTGTPDPSGSAPIGTLTSSEMAITAADGPGPFGTGEQIGSYGINVSSNVESVTFEYLYTTEDCCGSYWDMATYTVGSTKADLVLSNRDVGVSQTGTKTLTDISGKFFSINQETADALAGTATIKITKFSVVYKAGPNADVLLENSKPTLTSGTKTLTCTPGGFDMMRGGFFKQVGKPTSIVYTLIIAGKRVSSVSSDNWTGLSRVIYDSSDRSVTGTATLASVTWNIDSFAAGSAQCETMAYQESSVTSSNSNTL